MKINFWLLTVLFFLGFSETERKSVVFMIGDSTMADKPTAGNPERGWGQFLPEYFTAGVQIKNLAVNGRSTKSFLKEGRWDSVMKYLKKDDYVFIQFGHNDQKLEDSNRYAAPQTLYRKNLIRFVTDTRSKGATPILVTPVMRRKFDALGKFIDQHGEYPDVVRSVAKEMDVALIDLHAASRTLIEKEGVEGSKKLFLWIDPKHFSATPEGKKDDTHFSAYGAASMASLVCAEIFAKQLTLARYLKPSAHPEKFAFELPKIYEPHFKKDTFNIRDFGAKNNGEFLNTESINRAILTCSRQGGGTVIIPAGLWLTGPIVLQGKVNLHTERGALVLFTEDRKQYPLVLSSYEGVVAARCQSPVSGTDLQDVAITGEGIFHGSGDAWRPVKKGKVTESEWKKLVASGGVLSSDKANWFPSESALKGSVSNNIGKLVPGSQLTDYEDIRDFLRPNMLRLTNCNNVLLEGVSFENSPAWTLHLSMNRHVTIRKVTVKNPAYGQNTDALDLESCANVLVDECSFDTGDDGICIKSGRDEEGRRRGIPTENVIARNTTVYHAHGGFVVGSEMSGGAKNLFVSNCTFIGTDIGLRFKTTRGRGGVVENIYASNIAMKDIAGEAVLFDMYYMAKDPIPLAGEKREMPVIETLPVTEATPVFRNFYFHDIVCKGADKAIFIRGIPEMNISNIQMSNMVMASRKGIECTEAKGIHLSHIRLVTDDTNPLIYLQNCSDMSFTNIEQEGDVKLLFSINGNRSRNIQVSHSELQRVSNKTAFDFGALPSSIVFK